MAEENKRFRHWLSRSVFLTRDEGSEIDVDSRQSTTEEDRPDAVMEQFFDVSDEPPTSRVAQIPAGGNPKDLDVTIEENDDGLLINWAGLNDIVAYVLRYDRPDNHEKDEKHSHNTHYEMKTSIYGWRSGERVIISISAIDKKKSNEIPICSKKEYIIGGERVAREVKLSQDSNQPHNSLLLTWKKAMEDPKTYEVYVYEDHKTNAVLITETRDTSMLISNLKYLKKYFCAVRCKYEDGDGKFVFSNTVATSDLPEGFKQAQNVLAMKNPSNCAREIVVSWNGPKEETDISHFNVYLRFEENEKTQIHEVDPKKRDMKVIFKDLKSDNEYKAFVTTVFKNKSTVTTESDVVKTDPAQRTPGFNVDMRGMPMINISKEEKGEDIFGVFGWDLPDLGIDGSNYKIISEEPILRQDGMVKMVLDFENRHVKDVKLSWGRCYSFTVVCKYLDLDSRTFHAVQATELLNAGIGKHSIDDVKWIDNVAIVYWSKARGAKRHFLTVIDEEETLVVVQKPAKRPPTAVASMGKLAYGKMYKFVLEAHDGEGKVNREENKILLGGNEAVTEVVAKRDHVNPRRSLYVTWKPPVNPCNGYKLILYNRASSKSVEKDVPQLTVKHRFYELKTSTHYCLRVCPIYDGKVFEGTLSNNVQTEKRIESVASYNPGFGRPEKIVHTVKASSKEKSIVELSWTSVQMGENFRVTGYHVTCHQQRIAALGQWVSRITGPTICDEVVKPDKTSIEFDVKPGRNFYVRVSTIGVDLDTDEKTEIPKDHEIFTDTSKTVIHDCTWKNGAVYFSWEPVNEAVKYRLVVKDELLCTNLVQDQNFDAKTLGTRCVAKLQMSEELRIGKTCMTKVYIYSAGERTSETDWKSHVLGGEKVPRNVKAWKNSENPKRSAIITFDSPASGPASEYKIVAIPESGLRRTLSCKTSNAVFEYLRKGVKYKFEVHAMWDHAWSEGSPSNSISTEGDQGKPFMGVHDTYKTKVDLTNAVLAGKSVDVNVSLGKDFGQVEDLESKIEVDHSQDILTLKWNVPSFDKKHADHKVEMYKIELAKQNDPGVKILTVEFEKNRIEYETEKMDLKLGETYHVAVSTIYLDIDQDYVFKSTAVKKTIVTRPCIPECIRNDYDNETLRMEWNATEGAQRYVLELFANDDTKATFRDDVGKKTAYEKKFDERFGYGTSYYAVIKAFGVSGKENSVRTLTKIIGGDHVATDVCATSNHEKVKDPSTQVFLDWTAPKKMPKKYEVASFPYVESMYLAFDGTECLVSGLKAGTEYYFKVKAIHEEKGKLKPSGGCCSERISTTPTPTQVKKVWTKLGENPSTSVQICWEKVDAEKVNETTKYRIKLVKDDETTKREVYVTTEYVILQDLDSGSIFYATVAGGNSMGYGRDSERVKFTTDFGTPKNVVLENNEDILCSSLILTFANAEGEPTGYKATLYKLTNKVEEPVGDALEVKSGHTFHDLEPNREYLVKLYAGFASGEGKVVTSKIAMTAPAETWITECRCAVMEDGEKSPKEIFVKWNSVEGCNIHEITVSRGVTETIESRLILENKNELNYSCMKSSMQYCVRVRSRNERGRFGKWSNEALINLVPEKLRGVSATLEENGNDILIECNAAITHLPRYFMQTLCDDKTVGDPQESREESEKVIKWRFTPPECAQVYQFKLWAENDDKMRGEKTLTPPVISRPAKMVFNSVMLLANRESTDVMLEWEKQQRCDMYEISICAHDEEIPENMARTHRTTHCYRCQIPGKMYLASIRAIREGIKGDWSEDEKVFLAPNEVNFLTDLNVDNEPVTSVRVKWEPLAVQPTGYRLKLFCNEEEVDEVVTTDTNHKFTDKLKPGSLCFCTVVAFNESNVIGKASKSRTFHIEWLQASNFIIQNDDNEPSRRAKMKWDAPPGVNCFHLEIENNQSGVATPIYLSTSSYVFESGIPGNTYSVRLYCGCDDRYDKKPVSETMTMTPAPPSDIKVEVEKLSNSTLHRLKVQFSEPEVKPTRYRMRAFDEEDGVYHGGDYIHPYCTFEGLQRGKKYHLLIQSENDEKLRSIEAFSVFFTHPPKVCDLRLSRHNNQNAFIKWSKPSPHISGYSVRWKCGSKVLPPEFTIKNELEITGLKRGKIYRFEVAAENSSGQGEFSDILEFKTALKNLTEVEVTRSDFEPTKRLTVKIRDPDKKSKEYVVSAKATSDGTIVTQKTLQQTYGIHGLKPGETYEVFVRAEFQNKVSETAYAAHPIATVPDKVLGLNVRSADERYILKWLALEFPCKYLVQWKVGGQEESPVETAQCSYEWGQDLRPGEVYEVRVRAFNTAGYGEWSNPKRFTTGGEQRENVGEGNTTIMEGVGSYIGSAKKVHIDKTKRTETKVEKINVVSLCIPGLVTEPSSGRRLEAGSNDLARAAIEGLQQVTSALGAPQPNTDGASTSGCTIPTMLGSSARNMDGPEITAVPSDNGNLRDNTIPKVHDEEDAGNEDYFADCQSGSGHECLDQSRKQSSVESCCRSDSEETKGKDASDFEAESRPDSRGDVKQPLDQSVQDVSASSSQDDCQLEHEIREDVGQERGSKSGDSRSFGRIRRLTRMLFCCVDRPDGDEQTAPLMREDSE